MGCKAVAVVVVVMDVTGKLKDQSWTDHDQSFQGHVYVVIYIYIAICLLQKLLLVVQVCIGIAKDVDPWDTLGDP